MSVVTEVRTNARKPFYAYVGAADYAVEQAKGLPVEVQGRVTEMQSRLNELQGKLTGQARNLPGTAKNLRVEAEGTVEKYTDLANSVFTDFVNRGEKLVTSIRKQESTQETVAAAKSTKSRAKATSTLTKKTAAQASEAVEDATDKIG